MKQISRIRKLLILLSVLAICAVLFGLSLQDRARRAKLTLALAAALHNSDLKVTRKLVEEGADPNIHEIPPEPQRASGFLERIKMLLSPSRQGYGTGKTALVLAASYEDLEFVNLLLAKKVDVNAEDTEDIDYVYGPALLSAARVRSLDEAGVDEKSKVIKSRTLPVYAVLKTLLDHGAKVNAVDGDGYTALDFVARIKDAKCERLLLERGADAKQKSRFGTTPLISAVVANEVELARSLLTQGASPNDQNNQNGGSYLMRAASQGNTEMVLLLLEYGAGPNAKDTGSEYGTALIAAIRQKRAVSLIKILLDHGVKVNGETFWGQSAMDWAIVGGDKATISLLREAGGKAIKSPKTGIKKVPSAKSAG
jgi:ankyrin repeat protein